MFKHIKRSDDVEGRGRQLVERERTHIMNFDVRWKVNVRFHPLKGNQVYIQRNHVICDACQETEAERPNHIRNRERVDMARRVQWYSIVLRSLCQNNQLMNGLGCEYAGNAASSKRPDFDSLNTLRMAVRNLDLYALKSALIHRGSQSGSLGTERKSLSMAESKS